MYLGRPYPSSWVPLDKKLTDKNREHVEERFQERNVLPSDLFPIQEWRRTQPKVPPGRWHIDLPKGSLCGYGGQFTTFLEHHMVPKESQRIYIMQRGRLASGRHWLLERKSAGDAAYLDAPPTQDSVTESPSFKRWFAGSKIVDGSGAPLKVYHGTGADIDEFKYEFANRGRDQFGSGFYFTPDPTAASGYASERTISDEPKLGGEQANVIPVYLAIKKPVHVNYGEAIEPAMSAVQVRKIIQASPNLDDALTNVGDIQFEGRSAVLRQAVKLYEGADLLYQLTTLANDFYPRDVQAFNTIVRNVTGYDGVIGGENVENAIIVAWFPNQIKSALGNSGEFNSRSPKITASTKNIPVNKLSEANPSHKSAKIIRDPAWILQNARFYEDQFGDPDHPAYFPANNCTWKVVNKFPLKTLAGFDEGDFDYVVGEIGQEAEFYPESDEGTYLENFRKALLDGSIEPIVVVQGRDGKFYVWDGNHRVGEAQALGVETLPAYVGTLKKKKRGKAKLLCQADVSRTAALPPIDSDAQWAQQCMERARKWVADEAKSGPLSDGQLGRLMSAAFDYLIIVKFIGKPAEERGDRLQYSVAGAYNAGGDATDPIVLKISPGVGVPLGESAANGTSWWTQFAKRVTDVLVHERTHALQFNRWRTNKRKTDPSGEAFFKDLDRFHQRYHSPKEVEQSAYGDVVKYLGNKFEISAHARQAVQQLRDAGMTDREVFIWIRRKGGWNILAQKSQVFQSYYRIHLFNPEKGNPIFREFLKDLTRSLSQDDTAPISRENYELGKELSPEHFSEKPNRWSLDRKKKSSAQEAELPNGEVVLIVSTDPATNKATVTDRKGENQRQVRLDRLDLARPEEGISRELVKKLYAATSPALIGTVGDFLTDERLRKQFAAILWVPVWAYPGLAKTRKALGTTFNGGPKHIFIQLDGGADNQIFYHELVHADRIAKGRSTLKTDREKLEDSAERGQQYYAEREGKEFEKPTRRSASVAKDPDGLIKALESIRPQLSQAAQKVYDAWEQDEEGIDEEYGGGGICGDVAQAMESVIYDTLGARFPNLETQEGGQDGDDHAWLIVRDGCTAVGVDIPPEVYETGGGYSWTKREGVTIDGGDVEVFDLSDILGEDSSKQAAKTADRLTNMEDSEEQAEQPNDNEVWAESLNGPVPNRSIASAPAKIKYGTVQADLPEESEAFEAVAALRSEIDESDLDGKGIRIGRSHITVRYGIKTDDTAAIEAFLSTWYPMEAMLTETSSFEPSKSSDNAAVIISPVACQGLFQLNAKLGEIGDFKAADFDYKPHVTIAYIKPGTESKYVGRTEMQGKTFTIREVVVITPSKQEKVITLNGKFKTAADSTCKSCGCKWSEHYHQADFSCKNEPGCGCLGFTEEGWPQQKAAAASKTYYHPTPAAEAIRREGFKPSVQGELGPGVYISEQPMHPYFKKHEDHEILSLSIGSAKLLTINAEAPNTPLAIIETLYGREQGAAFYDEHKKDIWDFNVGRPNWKFLDGLIEKAGFDGIKAEGSITPRNIVIFDPKKVKVLDVPSIESSANNPKLAAEQVDWHPILTELMALLEPGLPVPKVKIVNSKTNWLGRCVWRYGRAADGKTFADDNTTIDLQKSIMTDEYTVRRVLAHELAHHEDDLVNLRPELLRLGFHTFQMMRKMKKDGHGPSWQAIAARFNAKYGADFVTKTSDESYVLDQSDVKPYFVFIYHAYSGKIKWTHANIISTQMRKYLSERVKENQELTEAGQPPIYRLLKTTDPFFMRKSPTIGSGSMAYTNEAEENTKLEKLWSEGEDVLAQYSSPHDPDMKPYFVLMGRYLRGKLAWQHAKTLTPKMKEYLGRIHMDGGTKLLQTDDPFFMESPKFEG